MTKILKKVKKIANDIVNGVKNVIDYIAKNVNNVIIWAFLTVISLGAVTYFVNIPIDYDIDAMTEYRDYIVNKRSLKIHIETCYSVSKMSERNKLKMNDTLEHLTSNGFLYVIGVRLALKENTNK